jgi:hypothetical protein
MRPNRSKTAKVFINNPDNNMVAGKKLWSERRRGKNRKTRDGNHQGKIKQFFNNQNGKNAKINNLGKEILSWQWTPLL